MAIECNIRWCSFNYLKSSTRAASEMNRVRAMTVMTPFCFRFQDQAKFEALAVH